MKKAVSVIAIILFVFSLSNCNSDTGYGSTQAELPDSKKSSYAQGLKIIDGNCLSCHSQETGNSNAVAPSLAEIKTAYRESYPSPAEFISAMQEFLVAPSSDKALMRPALVKFGIMPNLGYADAQYASVATYLFYADVEDADWFNSRFTQEKEELLAMLDSAEADYIQRGLDIALATKSVLGKTLLQAIKTKGTTGALEFCNERAVVISDSMSAILKADVKRVSDRNRNPNNAANTEEMSYIEDALAQIHETGKAKPATVDKGDRVIGYYPIMTNGMCLQCHGDKGSDMEPETQVRLSQLYPDDRATGYSVDQLRGIWVIGMDKKPK
jgi:mono/diheme cytochrome c family protein